MKITPDLISRLVREEVQAIYREEEEAPEQDEKGSDDEVQSAKDQGMRSDVERVAKFMFKHPQLSKALTKIKGNVEAAQLLGLLAQELGVDPGDISNVMGKIKKGMGDKEEADQEADADAKKAGGGEEGLEEGRYHFANSFDQLDIGDDPRAQAFQQCIDILDDQVYDSLEGDVASYADDAAKALWKAAEELDYNRNQVGNINEKRK